MMFNACGGDVAESVTATVSTVNADISDVEDLYAAAVYYEYKGFYQAAVGLYKKCIIISPENPVYIRCLADIYLETGLPSQSIQVYSDIPFELVEEDFSRLGRAFYKKGDYADAVDYYQQALTITSSDSSRSYYYSAIAKAYRELSEYELSDENFKTAFGYETNFWVWFDYGKLCAEQDDYISAVKAFENARVLCDGCPEWQSDLINLKLSGAIYYGAFSLRDQGETGTAKSELTKIIEDESLFDTVFGEKAKFWVERW